MKPFKDEIDDALRRKLRSSLEDFESEPDAALDRKMYKLLQKTPLWRNASVWTLVAAILFCGAVLLSYKMLLPSEQTAHRSQHSPSKVKKVNGSRSSPGHRTMQAKAQTRVAAIPDEPGNNPARTNEKKDAGRLRAGNAETISATTASAGAHLSEDLTRAPQVRATDLVVQGKQITTSGQKTVTAKESVETAWKEKKEAIQEYLLDAVPVDVFDRKITTSRELNVSELRESDFKLLTPVSSFQNKHQLTLPAIRYAGKEITASIVKDNQSTIHKTQHTGWSEAGKLSFIFNAISFQTVQQVRILPRSESRIQDVALPRAFSTLGYKIGAGATKDGFQVMANFSRINTQLGYAFSSDEYKIIETAPNEYEIQRLANKQYYSRSVHLVGIGIKKQIDFKSRLLGQLYSNVGAEYTRSLSPGSGGFLFANLSSGKRFTLNSSLSISAGPYFEYCFGKMNAAEGQIGIRPSQVGLLLTWKFSKPE